MHRNKLTSCQARAARAMLNLTIRELCESSGISESSIRRIESGVGVPQNVSGDLLDKLQEFFQNRGFAFTWTPHTGAGVHYEYREARGG